MNAPATHPEALWASGRHSWGAPIRFARKTERECRRCGMVKVTRHEPQRVWTEFWRNGEEKVEGDGTPICAGRNA